VTEYRGFVTDWTRDGRFVIAAPETEEGAVAIAVQDGSVTPLSKEGFGGKLSPDNRWIAYTTYQSTIPQVFVRPFSAPGDPPAPPGPRMQVSKNGGAFPFWRRDGKELFFRGLTRVMSVQIDTSNGAFKPGAPAALDVPLRAGIPWTQSKDGQRFLTSPEMGTQVPITVVRSWEAALNQKTAGPR